MPLISVVFSFRNEEEALPLVVQRTRDAFRNVPEDHELVFVDDASTDRSVEILAEQAKNGAKIRIVRMARRFGVEECFLAGIEHARGDAIIFMYTDLQDPPELIPEMLEHWRKGSDIVHTVRRKRIGESKLKVLAAHIAYRLISRVSEIPIPTDAGEFKLMARHVADRLLQLKESDPYLRGLIPWIGFKQTKIEYDLQPRAAGKSQVPLFGKKAWTVFLSGFTSFSLFPVYATLLAGLGATAAGLSGFFISLIALAAGSGNAGIAAAVSIAVCMWGILMTAVGFVGYYVGRAYKDVRGRPRYIVAEVVESDEQ